MAEPFTSGGREGPGIRAMMKDWIAHTYSRDHAFHGKRKRERERERLVLLIPPAGLTARQEENT